MATKNYSLHQGLPDGPIAGLYQEFRDNEEFLEMGYAGPFSTAKTSAMVDAAVSSCWKYPGAEVLIARGHASDLRATTLVTLEQRGGIFFSMPGGSKNTNLGEYRFPPVEDPMNPGRTVQSVIRAIGLDRSDLQDVMKSRQPFRVFLEEGNEMPPEAHDLSLLRARQKVYHRELKERHRVQKLSLKWGLPFRQVQAYLGLSDEELERPMQGLVGVKTIWNPEGNDHLWKRYVGVPYPEEGVTVEWAKKHIGIREEHILAAEHQNPQRRYEFLPDDVVIYGGQRRTVARQDGKAVTLIPQGERPEEKVDPKHLTLVVQRACLYAWPWMNKSSNKDNHKASFLIPNKEMAAKYFQGKVDVKSGLVLPQFDPTPDKGHVIRPPTLAQMKGHRAIGAVDHGGNHYTAAVIFIVTWDDRLVAVEEYLAVGNSASQNAYAIKGIVPPDVDVTWYCDPSMQRKAYETDAMSSAIDAYAEAGLYLEPAPAKGDEAVDIVKNMLVFKEDMIRQEQRKAEVYVSAKCKHLVQAWSELTWKDLAIRRDKWQVDIFDAAKYALAGKYAVRTSVQEVGVVRAGPQQTRWAAAPNERAGMRL